MLSKQVIEELIKKNSECDWLEYKINWFQPIELGQHISALSNSAAISNKEYGYLIWGVWSTSSKQEVIGTSFDFDVKVAKETLTSFLKRQITPKLNFTFEVSEINNKKIIVLIVPAAKSNPALFNKEAFIRVGTTIEKLDNLPEMKFNLLDILKNGFATITSLPSNKQELTFSKLMLLCAIKEVTLNLDLDLNLKVNGGLYNTFALLLSDSNDISIPVTLSLNSNSDTRCFSKEFGNTSIIYSLEKILEYGDLLNFISVNTSTEMENEKKEEIPFFNYLAFKEAIIFSFKYNDWLNKQGPDIAIYSNRIEISFQVSQIKDLNEIDFFNDHTIPFSNELSILLSKFGFDENSSISKIIDFYGKEAFSFNKNIITIKIPFNLRVSSETKYKEIETQNISKPLYLDLTSTQKRIIKELSNNNSITISRLIIRLKLSESCINKNIKVLTSKGIIKRNGSKKIGTWIVNIQ